MKKNKKKSNNYVDNDFFIEEMKKSIKQDELTSGAIECMLLIGENRSKTNYYFKYPEDRETCLSLGIEYCLRYWRNFDPYKYKNPFAYFTTIIDNGIKQMINQLFKHSTISIDDDMNFNY